MSCQRKVEVHRQLAARVKGEERKEASKVVPRAKARARKARAKKATNKVVLREKARARMEAKRKEVKRIVARRPKHKTVDRKSRKNLVKLLQPHRLRQPLHHLLLWQQLQHQQLQRLQPPLLQVLEVINGLVKHSMLC